MPTRKFMVEVMSFPETWRVIFSEYKGDWVFSDSKYVSDDVAAAMFVAEKIQGALGKP